MIISLFFKYVRKISKEMNKIQTFEELGVIPPILRALKDEHIKEPTEIQIKAIPLAVSNKDIIAGSATGSGKTLAFAATIIKNCEHGKGIQALVLSPTRELAVQVTQAIRKFSKYRKLNIVDVYGGVSFENQARKLVRADVVVATPGRLLDHARRSTINLKKVKILTIDEADRMFDMGFIKDIKSIISLCPRDRQTLLFSATISHDVTRLSRQYMRHAQKISATAFVDPKLLKQIYYDVESREKISLLSHLLKQDHSGLVMVFCNTKSTVNFVVENLRNQNIKVHGMHGGFSQSKRTSALESFHKEHIKVLVCTDVAARGLDIKGVSHIYNYDIPKETKSYIHRIGRTARAGKDGIAVNLLCRVNHVDFGKILKFYDVYIEKMEKPNIKIIKTINKKVRSHRRRFSPRRH